MSVTSDVFLVVIVCAVVAVIVRFTVVTLLRFSSHFSLYYSLGHSLFPLSVMSRMLTTRSIHQIYHFTVKSL